MAPQITGPGCDWTGLLARFRVLSMYYQQCHWAVRGGHYGDHLLFERLYNETNEVIDEIAEKGIGVTGNVDHVVLLTHLAAVTGLAKNLPQAPTSEPGLLRRRPVNHDATRLRTRAVSRAMKASISA